MESFLEPAKNAPEPTPIENYIFGSIVPEVSMISNTKTNFDEFSSEGSLLQMKRLEAPGSENICRQNVIPVGYKNLQAQFAKKQVRFESPKSQDISQKPLYSKNTELNNGNIASNYQNFSAIRKHSSEVPSNNVKPFEQIYMANIPDRKLDLSLIDVPNTKLNVKEKTPNEQETCKDRENVEYLLEAPKNELPRDKENKENKPSDKENKENKIPKTYQDFLELQKKITSKRKIHNDSVTDIFNYKRNLNCNEPKIDQDNKLQQTENETNPLSDIQKKYDNLFRVRDQDQFQIQQTTPQVYESSIQTWQPYNPSYNPYINQFAVKQKCDIETQTFSNDLTEDKALESKKYCEPSTNDLLKIITQQNEQLLILQKQVSMLLERDRNYPKPIEAPPEDRKISDTKAYAAVSTPQKNHFRQENTITKQSSIYQDNQRKWGMSKFSINLTTSFDMPLKAQQKQNFVNNEPQIQEITESDYSRKNDNHLEQSIHLQEPVNIREQCPSPQPSININMNDYESSDEETSSDIGTTFYNNLLGQVNNILKKDLNNQGSEDEGKRDKTLEKVREATLKHLKNIGITVDERCDLVTPTNTKNYSPSEISLTVKQLLMKYLPPDQQKKQEKRIPIGSETTEGILEARPEFSLASLEYMKKYNLIPTKDVPNIIHSRKTERREYKDQDNRKILDLTALKMQPKYL